MPQLSEGAKIRAQIDNEQIRALLLINGGGAITLLTILPKAFELADMKFMAKPILVALVSLMCGLVFAVISNQFRRHCSLNYDFHNYNPPRGKIFGIPLWAPTICALGQCLMWFSVAAFLFAGVYLAGCTWNAASIGTS